MKKFIVIVLIVSLFSTVSYANTKIPEEIGIETQDEKIEYSKLTQKQKDILSTYGVTEKEIVNMTLQEVTDDISNGNIVMSKRSMYTVEYNSNGIPIELKDNLNIKSLSTENLNGLRQTYTYEEIAKLDKKYLDSLFSNSNLKSVATSPNNYINVSSVPDGGGTNNYFNPSVQTGSSYLNHYVGVAKGFNKHIFSLSSNPTYGTYSYYLFGEWDGVTVDPEGLVGSPGGTHEGVDLKNAVSGKPVRSGTNGIVKAKNTGGSLYGYITMYDSRMNKSFTYMHVSNTTVSDNQEITTVTPLGIQSALNHVHFQVMKNNTLSIPSGKDDNISCFLPYLYMEWYID